MPTNIHKKYNLNLKQISRKQDRWKISFKLKTMNWFRLFNTLRDSMMNLKEPKLIVQMIMMPSSLRWNKFTLMRWATWNRIMRKNWKIFRNFMKKTKTYWITCLKRKMSKRKETSRKVNHLQKWKINTWKISEILMTVLMSTKNKFNLICSRFPKKK